MSSEDKQLQTVIWILLAIDPILTVPSCKHVGLWVHIGTPLTVHGISI